MRSTLLFLALLPLAACGSDSAPEASGETSYVSNETTSGEVPPRIGDIAGPEAGPTREAGPNEVVFVEADELGVVTVESGDDTYDVDIAAGDVRMGIDSGAVSQEALDSWLAGFSPLEAMGRYPDLRAEDIMGAYSAILTFVFVDDSGRTLFFQKQPDGVAVVSQADGPVWRLAPEAYRSLVPLVSDLRAN